MSDKLKCRKKADIETLLNVMKDLRDPRTGCSWDLEQTFESIIPFTIEEAYEVKDAIRRNDMDDLCDELGDLLLQVVFHAEIAKGQGAFDFEDVVDAITRKLIRRHPHVFGTSEQKQKGMQAGEWERIKAEERAEKAAKQQNKEELPLLLDTVPLTLPALTHAMKLQERAASVGFDWDDPAKVFNKLREEFSEFEEEWSANNHKNSVSEFGDILFVAVNLARHLKIDPEEALDETNQKFLRRFNFIQQVLADHGRSLEDASLDEMEALWTQAKSQ